MKTLRVTRRVARRWALRIRHIEVDDMVSVLRLAMPERDRDVVGAMLVREIHRRQRGANSYDGL